MVAEWCKVDEHHDERTGDWKGRQRSKGCVPGEVQQSGKHKDEVGNYGGSHPTTSPTLSRICTTLSEILALIEASLPKISKLDLGKSDLRSLHTSLKRVLYSVKRSASPRLERESEAKQKDWNNAQPTVDELLRTVKRLEKGFLSLADAVIAEIEGMREDARCWQEEREELWKTVMAFHSHQQSDMEPIHHRLDSLEKRTIDIEKHLQSRDPDSRIPANDRLEELERRACELEKQVKKQHAHFLHGPHEIVQEKPLFKEELVYRGSPLEQHRRKLEGSKRLGLSSRNCDPEETILAVRKEIEEFHGGQLRHTRITSRNGELQPKELQYYLSAFSHAMHKLQAWCKLFENDQASKLQRLTESENRRSFLEMRTLDWKLRQ